VCVPWPRHRRHRVRNLEPDDLSRNLSSNGRLTPAAAEEQPSRNQSGDAGAEHSDHGQARPGDHGRQDGGAEFARLDVVLEFAQVVAQVLRALVARLDVLGKRTADDFL
jgi:hypothetical protein